MKYFASEPISLRSLRDVLSDEQIEQVRQQSPAMWPTAFYQRLSRLLGERFGEHVYQSPFVTYQQRNLFDDHNTIEIAATVDIGFIDDEAKNLMAQFANAVNFCEDPVLARAALNLFSHVFGGNVWHDVPAPHDKEAING